MSNSISNAEIRRFDFDKVLLTVTRPIAFAGILAMLIVACLIVVNALLRGFFEGGIVALNEYVALIFAVGVMATIPAAAAGRGHLRVDMLEGLMSPRLSRWLGVVGGLLLALFLFLLARELFGYAGRMTAQGRTTPVRGLPIGPFMYAVAATSALATIVQLGVVGLDTKQALSGLGRGRHDQTPRRSNPIIVGLVVVSLLLAAAIGGYAALDFQSLSRLVQSAPMSVVGVAFGLVWLAMLLLVPVSAVLGLTGVLGIALFLNWQPSFAVLSSEAVGFLTNPQISALPLFLVMGSFATVAGLSDDVYTLAQAVLGRYRGGLALATIGGCAGFGAVTGSSLATAATFGRVSLPQMRSAGYDPALATGCVAAGGTLGALIPPSPPLIIFALLTDASIGQLFVGAVIPGLISVVFYLLTIVIVVRLRPNAVPLPISAVHGARRSAIKQSSTVIAIFALVVGGIYGGVFTVTEAASVGVVATIAVALWRGKLSRERFWSVMGETTTTTAMIYTIIIGALAFGYFVGVTQLPEILASTIDGFDLDPMMTIIVLITAYLLLGSVMDSNTIMVITVPIVTPLVLAMGYDIIWWGILMLVVVEIGLYTPPFGLHLFLLRSMQRDVPLLTIFRGVLPFCIADFVKLVLLIAIPALTLWLPAQMLSQ